MRIVETDLFFTSKIHERSSTKRAIVHHSASDDVPAITIHGWHLNRGWSGIGYHFVIRQNGSIEKGRSLWAIGAHSGAAGNSDSIGIVLTGNFEIGKPTQAQIDSLVWLLKEYLFPKYGELNVIRHKDVMATACPGRNFPWDELRKRLEEKKVTYRTINEVPEWGKPTIQKLVARKTLQGDQQGNLNISDDMLRILVILDREGVLK